MIVKEFIQIWPRLTKQVKSLRIPWLEQMSGEDRDPFKILISCILSLRTQDKTTEEASQRLFRLARTPQAVSRLSAEKIQKAIYPVGFYRVKAQRIKELGQRIAEEYAGAVPDTVEELLRLRGVGRKTANLVVTLGYDKPGICVDTHVHRITNRWGLIRTKTPAQTEFALREILPARYWKKLNGYLVAFGQGICKPISPLCSRCTIRPFCDRAGVDRTR
jgi:endonuclease-3